MKLKIIVKIVEKILRMTDTEGPRADMYLPDKLLAMSLVFLAIGIACAIFSIFAFAAWAAVIAVLGILLGIAALLCWRNQMIHVISDFEFTYTTMFGRKKTYSFSQIQGLRQNQDSLTLFVADEKVHMESMAIISDRLVEKIDRALQQRAADELE